MSRHENKDKQRELIAACNLICDFVNNKLPPSWQIVLTMESGDCDAALYDPDGDEVVTDGADSGISTIDDLCVTAIEMAEQRRVDQEAGE